MVREARIAKADVMHWGDCDVPIAAAAQEEVGTQTEFMTECLYCNKHTPHPSADLPVYCEECFHRLRLEGYSDPLADVALVHWIYWGMHLEGLTPE